MIDDVFDCSADWGLRVLEKGDAAQTHAKAKERVEKARRSRVSRSQDEIERAFLKDLKGHAEAVEKQRDKLKAGLDELRSLSSDHLFQRRYQPLYPKVYQNPCNSRYNHLSAPFLFSSFGQLYLRHCFQHSQCPFPIISQNRIFEERNEKVRRRSDRFCE